MSGTALKVKKATAPAVKNLYKFTMRNLLPILRFYEFNDVPYETARRNVAARFKRNMAIEDDAVIERLIFVGKHDLDETIRKFKTPPMVKKILLEDPDEKERVQDAMQRQNVEKVAGGSKFLSSFYSGN